MRGARRRLRAPAVEPDPGASVGRLSILCGEQLTTDVVVSGSGFVATPVEALTGEPLLQVPKVSISRAADVDGSPVGGDALELNPVPTDGSDDRVKWMSQEQLRLRISPDLKLVRGQYDIGVTNATGETAVAPKAFTVVPPPTVSSALPVPICTAQFENVISVEGTWLLKIGAELPTVSIGGKEFKPESASGCVKVETPRGDVEQCTQLTIRVLVADVAPGVHDVVVTNPKPAQCQSTAPVRFFVVPPPSVEKVDPEPVCTAQGDRQVLVTGTDFLVIGGLLPKVRYGQTLASAVVPQQCVPFEGLSTVQICRELLTTLSQGAVEPGIHAVVVENPLTAACESRQAITLTTVPPPTVTSLAPEPQCLEQGQRLFTLTGTGFIVADGAAPRVVVGGVDATLVAAVSSGCTQVSTARGDVKSCTQLEVTLAEDLLAAGAHAVVVHNPLPAGCESQESLSFTVVPKPTVTTVTPQPVCLDQGARPIDVSGTGFLVIDGVAPQIAVGTAAATQVAADASSCTAITTAPGRSVQSCTRLTAVLASQALAEGAFAVVVTNPGPAGCASEEQVPFTVVPPPTLSAVTPQPVCVAQGARVVRLAGTGMLFIDGAAPTVSVGAATAALVAPVAGSCAAITTVQGSTISSCTEVDATIAEAAVAAGVHQVSLLNPAPAGCTTQQSVTLTVTPPPSVAQVQELPVCVEQSARQLEVTGTGFVVVNNIPPVVTVGGVAVSQVVPVAGSCSTVTTVAGTVESCTGLTITLAQGSVAAGSRALVVTNPQPAGCSSQDVVNVEVVPRPTLQRLEPDTVCNAQGSVTVKAIGSDFLQIGAELPTVTVGSVAGSQVTLTAASCQPLTGVAGAQRCSELSFTIAQNALTDGQYAVTITNPSPAGCGSTDAVNLTVAPPPNVTSVTPTTICTGGGTFTITGTSLQGVNAILTDSQGGVVQASNVSVSSDGTSATASFGSGLKVETYTLTVTGPSGCSSSATSQVSVVQGPLVYYVDPPATYVGISVAATIYAAGITSSPTSVVLSPAGGGTEIPLSFTWSSAKPNVIRATLPSGLSGGYDLFVRGIGICDAFLANALTSATTLKLALVDVRPPFGLASASVDLTVSAEATPAAGQVNFKPTPRAYLSNATIGTAAPLSAVAFEDATRLTAVAPPLTAGVYDLIVVNPDGDVGLLTGAYRSTNVAPPVIDDVFPTQLNNDVARPITISGANFSPVADMAVTLFCKDPNGTVTPTALIIDAASSGPTSLTATVPSGLSHGSACAVEVRNTADITFDEWSALSITNPAGKLSVFQAATAMNTGRRSPVLVAGRVTRAARFLYALGGDSGGLSGALASTETASLGRFGEIGPWRSLQTSLPAARTLAAGFVDGRDLYVIGGHDGVAPVRDIFRATLLSPTNVPDVTLVDLRFSSTGAGLGAGAYTYLISAVFAASDGQNPNGESLPSEPVTLYAPAVPGGVEIELTFATLYGTDGAPATGYRVYRTPNPNDPISAARLLAVVPGTAATQHTFLDNNATFQDVSKAPLRTGATSVWVKLPAELATARAAFGFAVATDPGCARYWYLVGGMTPAATEESSYEFALFQSSLRSPGVFTTRTSSGLAARRELGTFVANNTTAPLLVPSTSCDSYLYAAYGAAGPLTARTMVTNARYARVLVGGVLASDEATPVADKWLAAVSAPATVSAAGYASFMTANVGYVIGGDQGSGATTNTLQGELCALTGTCTPAAVISKFSAGSNNLTQPRYLPGFARFGAFNYFAGGADGAGAALSSSEFTVR